MRNQIYYFLLKITVTAFVCYSVRLKVQAGGWIERDASFRDKAGDRVNILLSNSRFMFKKLMLQVTSNPN